jgi:hypothetical protein
MIIPFAVVLEEVRKAVATHEKDIAAFSSKRKLTIDSDERTISRSLLNSLSFLHDLVEEIRKTDHALLIQNRRWQITKIYMASREKLQSITSEVEQSKKTLLRYTKNVNDVWVETASKVDQALDHAMALSIEASKFHGSQVKLESELRTVEDVLQIAIKKAQNDLTDAEHEEKRRADLRRMAEELRRVNVDNLWADLGSAFTQGVCYSGIYHRINLTAPLFSFGRPLATAIFRCCLV